MATCPMCNAEVADDQMDQHNQETHPKTGTGDEGQQPASTPPQQ